MVMRALAVLFAIGSSKATAEAAGDNHVRLPWVPPLQGELQDLPRRASASANASAPIPSPTPNPSANANNTPDVGSPYKAGAWCHDEKGRGWTWLQEVATPAQCKEIVLASKECSKTFFFVDQHEAAVPGGYKCGCNTGSIRLDECQWTSDCDSIPCYAMSYYALTSNQTSSPSASCPEILRSRLHEIQWVEFHNQCGEPENRWDIEVTLREGLNLPHMFQGHCSCSADYPNCYVELRANGLYDSRGTCSGTNCSAASDVQWQAQADSDCATALGCEATCGIPPACSGGCCHNFYRCVPAAGSSCSVKGNALEGSNPEEVKKSCEELVTSAGGSKPGGSGEEEEDEEEEEDIVLVYGCNRTAFATEMDKLQCPQEVLNCSGFQCHVEAWQGLCENQTGFNDLVWTAWVLPSSSPFHGCKSPYFGPATGMRGCVPFVTTVEGGRRL